MVGHTCNPSTPKPEQSDRGFKVNLGYKATACLKRLKKNKKRIQSHILTITYLTIENSQKYRLCKVEIFKHNFRKLKMQRVGKR